jgi:hypothetical protein
MRKLLAVMLMGGALIVSTSAAFAQDSMGTDQPAVGQNDQSGSYTVDEQSTPYVSNTQAQ